MTTDELIPGWLDRLIDDFEDGELSLDEFRWLKAGITEGRLCPSCRMAARSSKCCVQRRAKHRARFISAETRRAVAKTARRLGGCAYCGGPYQCIDHVVPVAAGGTSKEGNLLPACEDCNFRKGVMFLAEWRLLIPAMVARDLAAELADVAADPAVMATVAEAMGTKKKRRPRRSNRGRQNVLSLTSSPTPGTTPAEPSKRGLNG